MNCQEESEFISQNVKLFLKLFPLSFLVYLFEYILFKYQGRDSATIITYPLFPLFSKVFQVPQATVRWDPQVLLASRVFLGSQALLGSLVQKEMMAGVILETV